MLQREPLLVTLLKMVDRLPMPQQPAKRKRGRPYVYSERLMIKALLIMSIKRLYSAYALLAYLDQEQVTIVESLDQKPAQALTLVEGGVETYLPLGDVIDLDAERMRISLEMENLTQRIADSEIRLRNSDFLSKAPEQVVQREKEKRDGLREQWSTLRTRLQQLNEL